MKKSYFFIVITVLIIAVLAIFLYNPQTRLLTNNELELLCEQDSDCVIVAKKSVLAPCCYGCGSEVLNKDASQKIISWRADNCQNVECPIMLDCYDEQIAIPRCVNKQCTIERQARTACVSEPRDIGPYEECCDNLKTIWGWEKPDGSCECSGPNTDCLGANTCAPCGNGQCEAQYKEDRCSCPEDCK